MTFDKLRTPTADQFRDFGIENTTQAQTNLDLLSRSLGAQEFTALMPSFFANLANTADPSMALNNFERFVSSLKDIPAFLALCRIRTHLILSLITIFGDSRFLSTFLIAMADTGAIWLADPDFLSLHASKAAISERLAHALAETRDDRSFYRKLRIFRKKEMLRIGLRDLLGKSDFRDAVEDMSDLAEVCLQRAYEWAEEQLHARYGRPIVITPDGASLPAGFAVIAMGKLGGRELNFSSDIDLMYIYTADGETEGTPQHDGTVANRITNHQYYVKLAEKITSAIDEKTEDGFVFRVDLRLRPEGQRGPLAQSLGGYEIYYESWGQTWERSALIKARFVAGNASVGKEFMQRITPFVYRKYLDYGAISEIREMKQKINKDVEQKGKTYRDVKLGYGGIREIEFVIQALQLIYGGRDRSLRVKSALQALHMLSQKGLLSYQEHASLSKSYVFLRTVEHRIQILDDLQTQTLPADEHDLCVLARRMGYRDRGREAALLLRDYTEHTKKVRLIYDNLFAFTGEEVDIAVHTGIYDRLLDADTTEQEAVALLARSGFREPGKAYRNLMLLREGPAFVHQTPRSRKLFHEIFPPLFDEILISADPDMALNHLESFLAAQGSWETVQSLVKIDTSAVKVLITTFANSEYLSRLLVSRPFYLHNMLEARKISGPGTYARLARELGDVLDEASDLTEKLDALRRFKHQEEIRIGMADLLSDASFTYVSHELSKLAEVCLEAALKLAAEEIAMRYGVDSTMTGLAVIGVGKLGGRELTYGSDLDILFVFSDAHASPPPANLSTFEYFSKVAEKTIAYLSTLTREGFVFRIDTRLRPTGAKGPLVQSIQAFKNYYSLQAETWELQSLLRARCVAGDRAVGKDFCSTIQDILYRPGKRGALADDIRAMRTRMEEEVANENSTHYNIKQGAGGLVDIEFLVQYFQLVHGKQHRWLRIPGTYNALRALKKEKLIALDDYLLLKKAWIFIRQLEGRMRIISDQATSTLSRNPVAIYALARRMGYEGGESLAGKKLLTDYETSRESVRSVFNRILQGV